MSYTLYSPKHQATAGQKIELFARFINFPLNYQRIGFDKIKSPEYLAKHPLGKVPSLQTPEGVIYESNTILRYLANKAGKFYGNTPAETATIDQWLEFNNTQLGPGSWRTIYPILGFNTVTKEQYEAGKKDYLETLRILESQLSKTHYLAGNEITIADISIIQNVRLALRLFLVEKSRATIPHVVQWYERLFSHKEVAEEFGKPWLCTLEVLPHFEVVEKKEEKKKEEKKEKAAEPKKEQKKKEQPKKKEEPKKKEDKKKKEKSDAEEEQDPFADKKKVNPLDLLPKSPFNLDDWKREFCNSPDKAATLKELWPKFDHQGWSLWKVHYIKYEGEGVVGYLTSNLKNGHIRNLDQHFRKYCFAVYGVYGEEGNYEIDGIFMWRGTELPEAWKEHNSYEYFTFTKLDENDPAVQKLTSEYWINLNENDTVEGRKVFDAKMYK